MDTYQVLAKKAVSVSDARKNLSKLFIDEPVVVLSNNKPAGYMLSAELFESMIGMIQNGCLPRTKGEFRPTDAEFKKMAMESTSAMLELDDNELGEFSE